MDKNQILNAGMYLALALWIFGKFNIFNVKEGSTTERVCTAVTVILASMAVLAVLYGAGVSWYFYPVVFPLAFIVLFS